MGMGTGILKDKAAPRWDMGIDIDMGSEGEGGFGDDGGGNREAVDGILGKNPMGGEVRIWCVRAGLA